MGEILDRTAQQFDGGERVVVDADYDGPGLSDSELEDVRQAADDASSPIWIALLPDAALEERTAERSAAGELARANGDESGTYLIYTSGGQGSTVSNVVGGQSEAIAQAALAESEADGTGTAGFLTGFIDRVNSAVGGGGGSGGSTDGTDDGIGVAGWAVPLGLVAGAGGVGWIIWRRAKRQREEAERAQLEKLRTVVDQDITAYGEELDRLDLDLRSPTVTDQTRTDYGRALDLYESAKQQTVDAKHPEDVQSVTTALEEGRYLLVKVEAESAGRPVPERRPPCFFDPRHGPSTEDVEWLPPMGMPRMVPACAADAIRIKEGADPDVRMVPVGGRDRPYYEAGGAYGPWAGGYFSGGLLPGLFWGTVIGSTWGGPFGGYGGYEGGDGGGGGDWGGGDFGGGGDWGGGDFGGFGGGDF